MIATHNERDGCLAAQATQVDNPDRYALATVTLRRAGGARVVDDGVRFSRHAFNVTVPEDAPPGTVLAALTTRQRDGQVGRD